MQTASSDSETTVDSFHLHGVDMFDQVHGHMYGVPETEDRSSDFQKETLPETQEA